MEIAGPIISSVIESLMGPIKEHFGYWASSRKYVRDMGDRMKRLNETADDLEKTHEANASKGLMVSSHFSPWLEDVKTINEEVASVLLTGENIACCNIKMRYKAGKDSSSVVEKIKRLEERKSEIVYPGEEIPIARVPSTKASTSAPVGDGTQNSFESRDLIFEEALKSLEPNNTKIQKIALCGMGGIGKTTMMEKLKKAVEHSRMFHWVVMVVVGRNTDPDAFQHATAEKTGRALSVTTRDARAARLESRFAGMSEGGKKKVLVILDDLWETVDLKDIGLSDPLPHGFKLLFTSRSEDVCTQMGVETGSILRIGALNDDEAETLFFRTVGLSKDKDPYLYKIGEDIIKRCGNLPIALKTIASTLGGKRKNESDWEEALSHLQHHDLKDRYATVHNVFEISYNYLKMDEDKEIFLLSGLFPDDFDIPMEELMRYGWGLKLYSTEVNTVAKARRRVQSCIINLINSNLLAESDRVGCVIMHDLARSFALSKFTKVRQASIVNNDDMGEWLKAQDANEYQRILFKCTGMSTFPADFNYPNLEFLKLMNGNELLKFPEDLYEKMENLKVVAYEEIENPLLPRSLQYSNNLTTLCLHGCELKSDCSPVGNLVNLEVLSFAYCQIENLPSSIGKLTKLKLLDLTGCFNLGIHDGVFEGLVSLEELYMKVHGRKAIRFTDASCVELEKLSRKLFALEVEFFENKAQPKNMSFTNLKRFKISIGRLLEDSKDMYSFNNTLKLVTNKSDLLGCKINKLFKETEKLHLQVKDIKHLTDVSAHPSQDSFSKLTVLDIVQCADLRYLFTVPMVKGLRKLERLTVSTCPVLESLIHGESENGEVIKFQKLKYLALNKLPMLGSLCDIDNKAVELPQLLELRLDDLPNFTSFYPGNAMKPLFNNEVAIPMLEKLKIFSMKNLIQIWPCEITTNEEVHVSSLRVVEVQDCDRLINLFPSNPMPMVLNLEELEVKACGSIEVLFNIDLGCAGKSVEASSRLRSIRLVDLDKLTEVWRIKGADNSRLSICGFQGVENIHIHDCKKFENVFTPTSANFDMRAVVDIRTNDSRDSIFREALKALHPDNRKTQKIALCGPGGVGKTRMMEQLKRAMMDSKMFHWVVMAIVGEKADPFAIQDAIAYYTVTDLIEETKEARADSLRTRFWKMSEDGKKPILIILDDLWEEFDIEDIGLTSPLPNGFKLLITSRDAKVCTQMGVENSSIFTVSPLREPEAKALFYETVGISDGEAADLELDKLIENILRTCRGLPVLIEVFAYALRGRTKDMWEAAVFNSTDFMHNILHEIHYQSYKYLRTEDKAILLLSGLFLSDTDIPIEDLVRYGWGLKVFNKMSTLAEARYRTNFSVDVLISANLLLKSDRAGCVKMDQHIRIALLDTVRQAKQAVIDHPYMIGDEDGLCERILVNCTGMSEFPRDFCHPNLTFLKLVGQKDLLKFPQDFYDRMEILEVVAYERIDNPLLPQYSTKLRTLCLDSCSLMDEFSFLGNLINLEVLSFAHCHVQKLPSMIGKLRKLKVLDVTGCVDLCIDDDVLQNLVSLEELYMRVHGSKAIRFTDANLDELKILSRGLCALEVEFYGNKLHPEYVSSNKLERFRISMGCLLDDNVDSFENTLKLVTNRSELLECRVNELFEKTENLHLDVNDMNNLEEVSMQYSFYNLRVLEVSGCADLRYLVTVPMASSLRRLERLTVSSCPVLESLIHGESENGGVIEFDMLKYLALNNLPMLGSLCDTENYVVKLLQLAELKLSDLPNFTSIYPDNATKPFFNKEVEVPNLEKLKISSMEKLTQIWASEITSREEEVKDIIVLREIEVEGCDSLMNLFPCNPLPLLNHLEELTVKSCGSIQVLFNIDLGSAGNISEVRSSLRIIRVESLGKLREMWRIKGANNSRLSIRGFQGVENIHIDNCTSYRNTYTPSTANFDMKAHVWMDNSEE